MLCHKFVRETLRDATIWKTKTLSLHTDYKKFKGAKLEKRPTGRMIPDFSGISSHKHACMSMRNVQFGVGYTSPGDANFDSATGR
jgi:hypothetical protein